GYMTNYNEEKFMNTADAQTLFAQAIFRGFEQYKSNWARRQLREDDDIPVVANVPTPAPAATTPVTETPLAKKDTVSTVVVANVPAPTPAATPDGAPVPTVPARACLRIQFMSSTTRFKRGDAALKGLWPVQCYEANGYFRYTYGEGQERAELQADILRVKEKFPDAFVVRFDEKGNRIK
ncbi:MAG: hypothetical protein J6W69_02025, partial [Bacteroidales bacterium]|nr:hypothetical protein [Bacteroidales bacterium]